ncbi:hypothetical protein AGMMS49965_10070 [Bacteroidia bacterium]|nr:hypothetical protein AGMMS49965_10070 [Bacteroidia bacterium]
MIEIISVHYKTPDLIYRQYRSVRALYPDMPYRIIDGSDDGVVYFDDLEREDKNFTVERFGYNIHHGPGMDYAIKSSKYDFLLILDSDVTMQKPIIEAMLERYAGYVVGRKRMVNTLGHQSWEMPWLAKLFPNSYKYSYIHPLCMLINRQAYGLFKPFIKHGSPCIDAMIDVYRQKKTHLLAEMDIDDYITADYAGTAKRWGMNMPKWSYLVPRHLCYNHYFQKIRS